jgi:sugar/nucleoside kinase (ribokinase family)
MRYDVLVVGDYSIDLIFAGLPGLPELGLEVIGSQFAQLPGETYTSAVAMHRLGLRVGWAADFGDDDLSALALRYVRAEGLDEVLFVHHKRPYRRVSVAASLPDDRAFITYYDPVPAQPAALKALVTATARALYLPGFYSGALFNAGRWLVRAKRMQLIMDGNMTADLTLESPGVRKTLAEVDVFLPNAREARQLTGQTDLEQAARQLAALGPLVVVKNGAVGAFACQADRLWHTQALPITPVDTTGAGDCFSAGFIKARLMGRPVGECLRWANIVGGLSTLGLGGTGQRVTAEEVARRFDDRGHGQRRTC